jgi:hypothetical protein
MRTDFGKTLARILAERRISQYCLAARSGVGTVTLNRIVNGVRQPTEWQVLRLAIGLTANLAQAQKINQLLDEAGLKIFSEAETYWKETQDDE